MRAPVEIDWDHDGCEVRTRAVARNDPFRLFGDILAAGLYAVGPWIAVWIDASAHPGDVMGWRLRIESLAMLVALLVPVGAWWHVRHRIGVVPAATVRFGGRDISWEVGGRRVGPLQLADVDWVVRATEGDVTALVIRVGDEVLRLAAPPSDVDRLEDVEAALRHATVGAWCEDRLDEPVPDELYHLRGSAPEPAGAARS
jgi:hypothetical protein